MSLLKTLKFQIATALLLIVALFSSAFTVSLMALEEQRNYNTLLNITARLQHTDQSLVSLGMNYAMNAPRDNASYQRDLKLYYQEIRSRILRFDEITNSFMNEHFAPSLTDRSSSFTPSLNPAVHSAVEAVEEAWAEFKGGLTQALGMDDRGPRLDEAADYITVHHQPLSESIDALRSQIQRLVDERLDQVNQLHWATLLTVIVVTLGILGWFFLTVLRPLSRAVIGFRKVAQGDFGLQVPSSGDNELSWLTNSFNQLSSRLHAIFKLIDQIQQGSDLDDTLCFVAEQFPPLLPLDWVGALFVAGNNSTIVLERSYREGIPEITPRRHFQLGGTLLQEALAADEPLHIPDMKHTAENNPKYQFLNHMANNGLRDAIFLPFTGQSPIPGVLAFATREPDSYSPEHLELLTNIAKLVTHSFGRTVKLEEHTRLAAIGGFASGIAHEIRSPLSTIDMALDYLKKTDLSQAAEKRRALASREAGRMARLLEEILLYAKPLNLNLQTIDLRDFLNRFIEAHSDIFVKRHQLIETDITFETTSIMGDPDRLTQVLFNLANNASEAAPEQSVIQWHLHEDSASHTVRLEIQNNGKPMPEAIKERLFDPFFTTKADGTGLGLGIVKRIIEAHGGEIQLTSDSPQGTLVSVKIPLP